MNSQIEISPGANHMAQKGSPEFVNATRVHHALTASLEKRLLVWLARRVPKGVNSDHLTALGFASQILAGTAYGCASQDPRALWLVNLFLVLNWLGDSLDGTVARIRNQQRPRYGFYVDHIADTIGAFALMAGVGCSGYIHWPIAGTLLVCFYALSIESYLATYTMGRFQLSHSIFGPTEIRILLIAGNCIVISRPFANIAGRTFLLFDVAGVIAVAGMTTMLLLAALRHTAALYREETR